jgi:hypothetical protein
MTYTNEKGELIKNINKGVKCHLFMNEKGELKLSLYLDKETINEALLQTGEQVKGLFKIEITEKYEGYKVEGML